MYQWEKSSINWSETKFRITNCHEPFIVTIIIKTLIEGKQIVIRNIYLTRGLDNIN